jgi:hypothetical protein
MANKPEYERWQVMVEEQKNNPSYEIYQKCVNQYEPFPKVTPPAKNKE